MRATRAIYIENDPALRGVITKLLSARPEVDVVGTFGSSHEALDFNAVTADVALIDLALGPESLNGTELGLVLRERNPNIGIVIFTQHVVPDFVQSLPEDIQWGWSFLEKRSDLDIDALVDVLRSTARGLSVLDPAIQRARKKSTDSPIHQLSARQREILALAATGLEAPAIAEHLGLTPATVRHDLSRAYEVLVPEPRKGTDLRTTAVLRYLRETRLYQHES